MQLTIVLRPVVGELADDASVTVEAVDGGAVELTAGPTTGVWSAQVPAGRYRIDAAAGELVAPTQWVDVGQADHTATVFLGGRGWPYYRLGSAIVPYAPHDDLVAIVRADTAPGADDDAVRSFGSVDAVTERLGLVPYEPSRDTADDSPEAAEFADGAIRLFAPATTTTRDEVGALHDRAQAELGEVARVGMPVDARSGHAAVVDRFFVVRFRPSIDDAQARALVNQGGADVERRLPQAPNAYLIRFASGHPRDHLDTIEAWHAAGLLEYGEPDLITEVVDDGFPYDDPTDPTFAAQANLTLQRFDDAWVQLADIDPKVATGSPRVTVATLDRGIDVDHPDLGGVLTDGTAQLARCFDFSGMRECTVPGYTPDTDHGMGVYGIVAAAVDNGEDIAGMAANTHHIGLERPTLTSVNYADVLLWAAGFTTGNTTAGWPNEPLQPAADIISCSHGSDDLALSGVMDDTFRTLVADGRRGLGTIVVYSAGNADQLITGFRTWAAHPSTIAVANSQQPDASGVETKAPSSNFGPEIDVCAQGAGAPSLDASGGEQTFGGTSAAAPTVAALCALVLTVDPTLTWRQVRDIVRETAVQIDPHTTDPVGRWRNGFSQWYGHGRIDAAAAVSRARPHRGRIDTDHDGDGRAEVPVTSPWGIGTLDYTGGSMTAAAMAANGSRFGGWLLNTRDNRFDVVADLDGDGAAELLVTSPWGIGVLNVAGGTYTATMLRPNGTRFGGWLLNTADNRFGPVGDVDGDGQAEFLVTSPWGVGVFSLAGTTFDVPLIRPNGTRFGGWLLNTADNRFGPVGDFDGDGCDEVLISSPWGIGLLKLNGTTFDAVVIKPNGTRFGGWLLNTADNHLHAAADFDGDGRDALFITSPWGIGILECHGATFTSAAMARNGSRFDGWLLNTADNHFKRFADLTGDGRADVLLTSPWGIGILGQAGSSFTVPFMARNGTRFGGWLLNTADNRF
jgi:hypothetical protein